MSRPPGGRFKAPLSPPFSPFLKAESRRETVNPVGVKVNPWWLPVFLVSSCPVGWKPGGVRVSRLSQGVGALVRLVGASVFDCGFLVILYPMFMRSFDLTSEEVAIW